MQRAQHFMARARCDDGNQPRSCSSGPDQQNGRQTPFKTDPKTKGQWCRKILSLSSWCEILEAAALSLLPGNFRITSCEFVQVLRCKSSNLEKQMLLRNFATSVPKHENVLIHLAYQSTSQQNPYGQMSLDVSRTDPCMLLFEVSRQRAAAGSAPPLPWALLCCRGFRVGCAALEMV